MTSEIAKIYVNVLVKKANIYMSQNDRVIFVTWVEQTKGAFKRLDGDDPKRIKKLGFEIKPGYLKERRMM